MEINYFIIIPILVLAIILLIFLIKKNKKDQKKFIEDMNRDIGEPENHPNEKI